MERLTLACLQHLPTAVLFVADLTGQCGTSAADQWRIRWGDGGRDGVAAAVPLLAVDPAAGCCSYVCLQHFLPFHASPLLPCAAMLQGGA